MLNLATQCVQFISDACHGCQLLFKVKIKWLHVARLGVVCEDSSTAGHMVAAPTHARVVAQPTVLQVRVKQSVCRRYPLLRIEDEHLAKKMNNFMVTLR